MLSYDDLKAVSHTPWSKARRLRLGRSQFMPYNRDIGNSPVGEYLFGATFCEAKSFTDAIRRQYPKDQEFVNKQKQTLAYSATHVA